MVQPQDAVGATIIVDPAICKSMVGEEEDDLFAATITDTHHNASAFVSQPKIRAFLDTGALDFNYISYEHVYELNLITIQLNEAIFVESVAGNIRINKYCIILRLTLKYDNSKYELIDQKF